MLEKRKKYSIRKTSKYFNTPTLYRGYRYMSKAESQYAMFLDSELHAKRIKGWSKQVKVPIIVNGVKICDYLIDFVVHNLNGDDEWVEIKGIMTGVAALKIKLFKALYPTRKFKIVRV